MVRSPGELVLAALTALFLVPAPSAEAQAADPDPARYAEAIETFETWDSKNTVPEDAVLFVGSSSIRFWPTADWFPDRTVVNRGFGGAHISDVNHYAEETVLRHSPDVVVFYAGDNDIAADKTPAQVLEDFRAFVDAVDEAMPDTRIVFIAIKPSLARWSVWPQMQDANQRIRSLVETDDDLFYADVAPPMLGDDGMPIPGLFVDDGLHMTPAGYEIWTDVLNPVLDAAGR